MSFTYMLSYDNKRISLARRPKGMRWQGRGGVEGRCVEGWVDRGAGCWMARTNRYV